MISTNINSSAYPFIYLNLLNIYYVSDTEKLKQRSEQMKIAPVTKEIASPPVGETWTYDNRKVSIRFRDK